MAFTAILLDVAHHFEKGLLHHVSASSGRRNIRRTGCRPGVSKARNRALRACFISGCARATRTSGTARDTVMSEKVDAE